MAEFYPGPYSVTVNSMHDTKHRDLAVVHGVTTQPTEDGLGQSWVQIQASFDWYETPERDLEAMHLATAHLFASAPALYVALKDLRDWFNGEDDETQNQDIILAADKAMALARNEVDESDIRTRHERVMNAIEQSLRGSGMEFSELVPYREENSLPVDGTIDLAALATAVIKECFR